MPVISPAIGVQGGSHSALSFRQLASALVGADVVTFTGGVSAVGMGHGLVRPGHLAVTQNGTPNMSVNVAAGTALVNGTSVLAQGVYAVTNDAQVNLAIATADATNPRRDLVCLQVRDTTADGSGFNDARLFVVTGTPAASPVDPTVPAGCLVLARVQVNALATSIVNATITALPQLARGSNWNVPWGQIAYAQVTTGQGGITAVTDLTGLTVTFTAIAGRRYRTSFYGIVTASVASDAVGVNITTGANANVQTSQAVVGVAEFGYSLGASVIESLSAGSHTRKLRMVRNAGSGTCLLNADATFPAFILVEDIGPA